jgi:O-antigen ligase
MRKLDIYFSSAFSYCLFFPTRLPTYALELYGLYIILDLIIGKSTLKDLHSNLRRFPPELSTLVIFFLINLLSIIMSDRTDDMWHQIEKRLSFVLIPLIIVIRKNYFFNFTIERILTFFVLGAFASTVLNFFRAIYRSISWVKGELIFNASVEEHRSFFEAILFGGNFFFYEEYSSFMHPTYFGLYILYAVFLLLEFLRNTQTSRRQRGLVFFLIIWFLVNIFLLSSRAVLLSTFLFLTIVFFKHKDKITLKTKAILLPLTLAVLSSIISFNPRSSDLLKNLDAFESPRILILKASSKVIKDNYLFGTGVIDLDYEMLDAYRLIGFDEGLILGYNLHNQYLETLAGCGIIGFLSLLLMMGVLAKKAITQQNNFLFGIISLLAFNFLFESILSVYSGIVFFCFMSSILSFYKAKN